MIYILNYFYFIIFLIILIFSYKKLNFKYSVYKYSTIFLIFIYSIIISFRSPELFPDLSEYIRFYNSIEIFNNHSENYSYFEPGFILISRIIKSIIGSNIQIYLAIISLIQISILSYGLYIIFKYIFNKELELSQNNNAINYSYKALFYSIVLYLPYYGLYYNAIVIRQAFSISILLLAISYYITKKKLLFLLFSSIAITFHYSSAIIVIILCIIFIYNDLIIKKNKKIKVIKLIIISIILLFIKDNIMAYFMKFIENKSIYLIDYRRINYIARIYNEEYTLLAIRNIIVIAKTILLMIIASDLLNNKLKNFENKKIIRILIDIYFIGIFLNIVVGSRSYIQRIYDYFYIIFIIIIPMKMIIIKGKENIKYLIIIIFIVIIENLNSLKYIYYNIKTNLMIFN